MSTTVGAATAFSWGGDEQLRPLEHHSRGIWYSPDLSSDQQGLPVDCLRFRERVWLAYADTPQLQFYTRASHRFWHYYSRPGPNDQKRATWRFPDEVVCDNLFLNLKPAGLEGWTFVLGRQDLSENGSFVFGNGMILNDGTTLDGGRTANVDGVLASWKSPSQTLRIGFFGLTWKDRLPIINDVQRPLRYGNTQLFAADWTAKTAGGFGGGAFVYDLLGEDEFSVGQRVNLRILGARLFQKQRNQTECSLEIAAQEGRYQGAVAKGPMKTATGWMADLRLTQRLGQAAVSHSYLKFDYTWFSGDHTDTGSRYEGWYPALATNVPLFREECYYTLNRGWWSNLHHLQLACEWRVFEGNSSLRDVGRLVITPSWTSLYCDQLERADAGRHIGEMPGLFIDWQCKPWMKVSLLGAVLLPGNRYQHQAAAEWVRVETLMSF